MRGETFVFGLAVILLWNFTMSIRTLVWILCLGSIATVAGLSLALPVAAGGEVKIDVKPLEANPTAYKFRLKNDTEALLKVVLVRHDRRMEFVLKPGEVDSTANTGLLLAGGDRAIIVFDKKTGDLLVAQKVTISGDLDFTITKSDGGYSVPSKAMVKPLRAPAKTQIK